MESKYHVTLTGVTPLLMHKDNIEFSSSISLWQKDPKNKKTSVSGDDRSPAWIWIGYLYTDLEKGDKGKLIIDSDNIMTMLREAGAKMSTGKGKATYKAVTQYGLFVDDLHFRFYNNGAEIQKDWINALVGENNFDKHLEAVNAHGFELFLKRAKLPTGRGVKHVRVRPKFNNWSAEGCITVVDPEESGLTQSVLQRILDIAGGQVGLCDWRPSSGSSGSFGKFTAKVESV